MYINKQVYIPLLQEFAEATLNIYEDGYPHGIFVPYVFDNYQNSSTRIFYLGQDTYYWMEDKENYPGILGSARFKSCI